VALLSTHSGGEHVKPLGENSQPINKYEIKKKEMKEEDIKRKEDKIL